MTTERAAKAQALGVLQVPLAKPTSGLHRPAGYAALIPPGQGVYDGICAEPASNQWRLPAFCMAVVFRHNWVVLKPRPSGVSRLQEACHLHHRNVSGYLLCAPVGVSFKPYTIPNGCIGHEPNRGLVGPCNPTYCPELPQVRLCRVLSPAPHPPSPRAKQRHGMHIYCFRPPMTACSGSQMKDANVGTDPLSSLLRRARELSQQKRCSNSMPGTLNLSGIQAPAVLSLVHKAPSTALHDHDHDAIRENVYYCHGSWAGLATSF